VASKNSAYFATWNGTALMRSVVGELVPNVWRQTAGKVPVYPGIGLSVWKDPKDAVKIARQIEIVRELGLGGFTVFNYDANAEAVLPFLRLGTTSK
jgi:hypothetical protein